MVSFCLRYVSLCDRERTAAAIQTEAEGSHRVGDHFPPRAPFQILIALCATPRFLLIALQWMIHRSSPRRDSELEHSRQPIKNGLEKSTENRQGINAPSDGRSPESRAVGSGTLPDIEAIVGIVRTFCW